MVENYAKELSSNYNPPNHLLVEPWYYHGDGSKITLYFRGHGSTTAVAVKNQVHIAQKA